MMYLRVRNKLIEIKSLEELRPYFNSPSAIYRILTSCVQATKENSPDNKCLRVTWSCCPYRPFMELVEVTNWDACKYFCMLSSGESAPKTTLKQVDFTLGDE